MAKKRAASALMWGKMPRHLQEQMIYFIARCRVQEKFSFEDIVPKLEKWLEENADQFYNKEGEIHHTTVGRHFADAVKGDFLQLNPSHSEFMRWRIIDKLHLHKSPIKIFVALDRTEMLRLAWLDFKGFLTDMINDKKRKQIVVSVSGGRTLMDFSEMARNMVELKWDEKVARKCREKVVICSLNSGGIRSDIAALSDTVAAGIANYLGAKARGLLGPAWFADKSAMEAFCRDQDVEDQIQLARSADIILAGIGYLGDPETLLRKLLDRQGQTSFIKKNPHLADMLYNCYDGLTGDQIELPSEVANGLFSVVDLKQLKDKICRGSLCLVLASGKEKGRHVIKGILKKGLASHVYLDYACAEGCLSE